VGLDVKERIPFYFSHSFNLEISLGA